MGEDKINVWLEDLIWCPSQCYYYFTSPKDNKNYCLYLRWRWSDPWAFEIIPCIDGTWDFDYDADWEYIEDIGFFKNDEYRGLEEKAIEYINKKFNLAGKDEELKNRVYGK